MSKIKTRDRIWSLLSLVLHSSAIRLEISLLIGLLMNLIYITENLISAIIYRSAWSASVTAYHTLFVIARAYLLGSHRREFGSSDAVLANRICQKVGASLLILDVLASFMMLYSVHHGQQISYSGIVLFGFFIYTAYSLATSMYGMYKWSNDNKPLHFAARNITFAASLMSAFNLQYSLLLSLGASRMLIRAVGAAGGVIIFLAIALLAFHLIYRSSRNIRLELESM